MNSVRKSSKRISELSVRKVFILFLYSLLCTVYSSPVFVAVAAGADIGEIEIKGLYSIGKDELLYLLDIKPGDTIDADHVRTGIKRAFLKGIFEDISVETTDGEKTKVIIHVKEKDYIKSIYVEGDYELSKKTIKGLFPLKEGQALACDLLEKALKDLKAGVTARGFPNAGISAEVERLEEPYRINIRLQIDTGEPERLRKITITGAGEDVKSVMKLSEGDIFDRMLLKRDLERIKAYFKKQEYFKPVAGPYTFAEGELSIRVNPGKRLEISIEGNDRVSTKTLLKEIPFSEAEDFSDDILEEAVQRMSSAYHAEGHPFVQIAPVVTSEDNLILLNFFIFEGAQVEISKISFVGNTLADKSLKEIMSLREGRSYNPDLIDSDRDALKDFYNALGYLNAEIEEFQTKYDEDSEKMALTININEGPKTEIGQVSVVGIKLVSEADVRKTIRIKPGDAYNEVDISDARYRVIEFYANKGFPEVTVSVERKLEGQKASLTFRINEGTAVLFGKAIITGNNKTKYIVVKRELLQEEDVPFDYSLLAKERQKLYKLGLFTDVDMEVLDRYDHKRDVLMKLNEGNAGAVEVSLGYGDYERYRGVVDLSYRNLMGMNRQASLRFELSSLEKRYILQYYEPWFLDIPLPFRAFLLGEERKEVNVDNRETRYRLTRHTVTAGFEKKLSETLKAAIYYEFSLVNTFDVKPDVVLSREDTGTLVISGLRFGIIYDTRNDVFYPEKGIFSGIGLKFTSPLSLSETDFIKVTFYGNVYRKLMDGAVLAISLRGGVAQGYNETNELPIVERFFLGGGTTVRGYDQDTLGPKGSDGDPTGGNAFLMENLEIRASLGKGVGLVAFLDGGNVWVKIDEVNLADLKFTTGLGLRYNTPVGPVRVDYGHKLQKEKGESSGELHFSIGHAF